MKKKSVWAFALTAALTWVGQPALAAAGGGSFDPVAPGTTH